MTMQSAVRASIAATLLAFPTLAFSQVACPTAEALNAGGILFTQDNGDFELHRMAPNGAIQQSISIGEYESLNYLAKGVHVLQLSDVEDGRILPDSLWQFAFDVPIEDLPAPVAGGRWSARTTLIHAGDTETERVRHSWGRQSQVTIGTCTLDAIPVTVKYDSADYDHTEESLYFPDLGTAILTRYSDDESNDRYSYVSMQAQ